MQTNNPHNVRSALEAIANMKVDTKTNHAELSALCIAIAKTAIESIERGPLKKAISGFDAASNSPLSIMGGAMIAYNTNDLFILRDSAAELLS